MKKFLAIVLAVAMMLSLAAVSFASNGSNNTYTFKRIGADAWHFDEARYYGGLVPYGSDYMMMNNGYISYGAVAYYPIIFDCNGTEVFATDSDLVEKLKIKAEFETGEHLVGGVEIVKKRVDSVTFTVQNAGAADAMALNEAIAEGEKYFYFVKIPVNPYITTGEDDVIGTLTVNQKDNDDVVINGVKAAIAEADDVECPVEFNVHTERHYNSTGLSAALIEGNFPLEYDKVYALKFNNDDEVELDFGGFLLGSERNEGTFTVDVSGQGKVILMLNTTADEAIAAANPGVKMMFVNFNNVKFNRAGEFRYEMEDMAAAYRVVNGQLLPIAGLEIEDDEAVFNTSTLGSYVFADAELVNPVA